MNSSKLQTSYLKLWCHKVSGWVLWKQKMTMVELDGLDAYSVEWLLPISASFIWFWCLHGERWKGKEKQSEKASRAQSSWWVSPERRASQITCHELLKAWLVTNNESCKTINGKKHQIVSVPSEDVSPYVLCSRLAGLNLDPHHVASI